MKIKHNHVIGAEEINGGNIMNCRIHLLLITFIILSWVLLFVTVSFSDHHAFRYETNKDEIKKQFIDPCNQCWRFGIRGNSSDEAEGIRRFYFHTLATTFTTLQVRLQLTKKVAQNDSLEIEKILNDIQTLQKMLNEKYINDTYLHVTKDHNTTLSRFDLMQNSTNNDVKFTYMSFALPGVTRLKPELTNFTTYTSNQSLNSNTRYANIRESSMKHTSVYDKKVVNSLVSVILDCRKDNKVEIIIELLKLYPECQIHIIVNTDNRAENNNNVYLHIFPKNITDSKAYSLVIDEITTPYTFLTFGMHNFSSSDFFMKLVMMISNLSVWAISGSLLVEDRLEHGCEISSYRNYKAKWLNKRLLLMNGCLVCEGLGGPFLSVTETLQELNLNENLPILASVKDLFLRSTHRKYLLTASCPFIRINTKQNDLSSNDMAILSKVHNLKRIEWSKYKMTLKCSDMNDEFRKDSEIGPPCLMKDLVSIIQFIMDTCEKYDIFCELQEGTLLGAVKFGSVLPWEKDADITFLTANFTALQNLQPIFSSAGYTLKMTDNRWCCKDGIIAGGRGVILSDRWILELWSQHAMDSAELAATNQLPTRVEMDGKWVLAPRNPGKHARNRYGREIYRHVQHWMELGKRSGWEEYKSNGFQSCGRSGFHSCLDLFPNDGSINFGII